MTFSDPAPRIASIASRLFDCAASTRALAASSGVANVLCADGDGLAVGVSLLQEDNKIIKGKSAVITFHMETMILLRDIANLHVLTPAVQRCHIAASAFTATTSGSHRL